MADLAAAARPKPGTGRVALERLGAGTVIVAAVGQAAVGVATSTAFPQLAQPGSAWFGPSGVLLTSLHVATLLGIASLFQSRVVAGFLGRLGLTVAVLGLACQGLAEGVLRLNFAAGNSLFGVAVPAIALGFVLLGVATLRSPAWRTWHRVTPLLCGLYVPLVLIPAFTIAGGPSFAALAVWQFGFVLLGAAMWDEARDAERTIGGR